MLSALPCCCPANSRPGRRFGLFLLKQTTAPQLKTFKKRLKRFKPLPNKIKLSSHTNGSTDNHNKKQGGREIKRYCQCSQTAKLQKESNSPTEFLAEILYRGLQLSRGLISVNTGHLHGELQDAYDQLKQCQHPAHRSRRQTAFSNKKRSLHTGIRLENFTKETTGNKGKSAFRCFILCPNQDHRRTENFIQIFQTVPAKSADAASGSKTTLREPDNRSV